MIDFFKIIALIVVILVAVVILGLLLALGVSWLLTIMPCELLAYVETAILFILVLIIALIIAVTQDKNDT